MNLKGSTYLIQIRESSILDLSFDLDRGIKVNTRTPENWLEAK